MNSRILIPIMAKESQKEKTWFLDVTDKGIKELIELKNSLSGLVEGVTIAALDSEIYKSVEGLAYNSLQNDLRRTNIKNKTRQRDLTHKRHRRR